MTSEPGGLTHLDEHSPLYIIVPAAGSGTRMSRPVSSQALAKQYLPILNKPIIEHTLEKLLMLKRVQTLFVAIAKEDTHWPSLSIAKHPKIRTVIGGADRAESVLNGLLALPPGDNRWVLVHDAARPCVKPVDIERLIQAVTGTHCGGILATPVVDTVKKIDNGYICETISRERLYRAQTPQLFSVDGLTAAMIAGRERQLAVTDEASAMELSGTAPFIVEGSASNIKVTVNHDLALAKYYLQERL